MDEAVHSIEQLSQATDRFTPETTEWVETGRLMLACLYPSVDVPAKPTPARADAAPLNASPQRRSASLLARALRRGSGVPCGTVAEQALQSLGLEDRTLWLIVAAMLVLISEAHPTVAARWCDPLLAQATARRAPTWQAIFSELRAEVAIRQGDLRAASRYARDALTLIPPKSWGIALAAPVATLVNTCTAMGRYEEAIGYLRMPMPDPVFQTPLGLHYIQARGRYYQANWHYSAALADFQTCGAMVARWRSDFPTLVPWRIGAAQASVGLGRKRQARELITEQLGRLDTGHTRTRGICLRVLAAAGDVKKRPIVLGQAIEALQRSGDRMELARAMADLGEAHASRGELGRARTLAQQANRAAQQCGAPALVEPPEPDTHGAQRANRSRRFRDLTDSERRVATLAARGHTNRQIATELHVTISTVEQHLTRVYSKLEVQRRVPSWRSACRLT